MARKRIALLEALRKAGMQGDVDFLREGVKLLAAALMALEVRETGERAVGGLEVGSSEAAGNRGPGPVLPTGPLAEPGLHQPSGESAWGDQEEDTGGRGLPQPLECGEAGGGAADGDAGGMAGGPALHVGPVPGAGVGGGNSRMTQGDHHFTPLDGTQPLQRLMRYSAVSRSAIPPKM